MVIFGPPRVPQPSPISRPRGDLSKIASMTRRRLPWGLIMQNFRPLACSVWSVVELVRKFGCTSYIRRKLVIVSWSGGAMALILPTLYRCRIDRPPTIVPVRNAVASSQSIETLLQRKAQIGGRSQGWRGISRREPSSEFRPSYN